MTPNTILRACLPALTLAAPAIARAEDAGPPADIIVTALRTPVPREQVAASVTVLDDAAISESQPLALTDILVRTPGISLVRNGGYGTATSLRIRGADAGQSVMVIDGMRLSDPSATAGGYSFSNLLLDDIDRIEILRGPQSILWGSDAIGGVINVTTRRPEQPLEGSFSLEAGSHELINARAAVGGTSRLVDWRLSGSAFSTNGISARTASTEADGYQRQAVNGTVTLYLAPAISLDLRGYWANARNDFDGVSGDSPDYGLTREWSAYAGLNFILLDGRFANRIAVLDGETDRRNFNPLRTIRQLNFDANGHVRRYEYQGTLTLSPAVQMVVGAERDEQRMSTASPADNATPYALVPNQGSTNSVYGQFRLKPIRGLTLGGGLRHDDQSRFGANTVVSAGATWSPDDGATVLRASYDEGYKAPSLYQLFSFYGSSALQPEKARGWEAGIDRRWGSNVELSAAWFERDTRNLIDFAFCPTTGPLPAECTVPGTSTTRFGYYANLRRSKTRGIELTGSIRLGALFANGNYSWIAAEDHTPGANEGVQLARVPRHLANATIGYASRNGFKASVAVRYAGKTIDRSGSSSLLDDYWLTDLRAEWQPASGLTILGRVENIGDVQYQTANGYNMLGRTITIGIRSRF